MLTGLLKRRFVLQKQKVTSSDNLMDTTWSDVCSLWGRLQGLAANKSLPSDYQDRITHAVTVRYRSDCAIESGMRLVCSGRLFFIRSVEEVNEPVRWLRLLVEEDGYLGGL